MLNDQDLLRVAAEAIADLRTVRKAYAGRPVVPLTFTRLALAAQRLGLSPPPAGACKRSKHSGG